MSLLAPAFLAGLLAIGLPLWLHRLSSDNPNKQRFSSLMFLEPGEPRRVLAKKLQYLLLLALRIGVLVLLVLAFAQPLLWRSEGGSAAAAASLNVMVMDASASMSYGERWSRAQRAALGVIDGMSGGDEGQLLAAGRVTELVSEATTDRALLRQRVNTLEPGVFRVDYGQLMRAVDALLRNVDLPVVLHVVTDAQRSALPSRFAELAPRRPLAVRIHDVSAAGEENWALESFGGSAVTGELEATVRSFAASDAARTVRLEHNGRVVEEREVTVPAGGRVQARFAPLELASGPNRVRAYLTPGDPLPLDDQRFLVLKRPEPRPVLLVGGDARGRGMLYTGAAMETLQALALRPERIAPGVLRERALTEYGFTVITDAGALPASDVARLTDYVSAGGTVLLAFGQRAAGLAEVPVTGHAFRVVSTRAGEHTVIGTLDANHPALRGAAELRSARFFRYMAVDAAPEDRVLIRLDDDTPLLIERPLGRGRVLLFTSSLDREWNDVPVQPAFVPFIAGLSDYLLGAGGFSNEAALGSTLAVRAMGLRGGQIFDPRGRAALGLGGAGEDVVLDQLGFYEVVGGGTTEVVAVNFDSRESDLSTMDAATIERWEQLGQVAGAPTTQAARETRAAEPTPLGPWLLWVLVLAAIVESWVGNWHLKVRRAL